MPQKRAWLGAFGILDLFNFKGGVAAAPPIVKVDGIRTAGEPHRRHGLPRSASRHEITSWNS